jgi:hypothetical protein
MNQYLVDGMKKTYVSFLNLKQPIKVLMLIITIQLVCACNSNGSSKNKKYNPTTYQDTTKKTAIHMTYQEKLLKCKAGYPFTRWRKSFDDGFEQYTEANCNKAKNVFDGLLDKLIKLGEQGSEEQKTAFFKEAVLTLNALNEEEDETLIETGEREELCELINQITGASGLNPKDYGDGEGLASEWREW